MASLVVQFTQDLLAKKIEIAGTLALQPILCQIMYIVYGLSKYLGRCLENLFSTTLTIAQ